MGRAVTWTRLDSKQPPQPLRSAPGAASVITAATGRGLQDRKETGGRFCLRPRLPSASCVQVCEIPSLRSPPAWSPLPDITHTVGAKPTRSHARATALSQEGGQDRRQRRARLSQSAGSRAGSTPWAARAPGPEAPLCAQKCASQSRLHSDGESLVSPLRAPGVLGSCAPRHVEVRQGNSPCRQDRTDF